jgi:hypothetical protein
MFLTVIRRVDLGTLIINVPLFNDGRLQQVEVDAGHVSCENRKYMHYS